MTLSPSRALQNVIESASHVSLTNYPRPSLQGAFHLTQASPHAQERKHGRSLTIIPWTTTDEFNVLRDNLD